MARPLKFAKGTQVTMVRLPMEQYEALIARTDAEGIPMAEQIRRAVDAYLALHTTRKTTRNRKPISLRPRHAQGDK